MDPGGWSAQENVEHLLDLEPLWFHGAEQYFAAESERVPADVTNRATTDANQSSRGHRRIDSIDDGGCYFDQGGTTPLVRAYAIDCPRCSC